MKFFHKMLLTILLISFLSCSGDDDNTSDTELIEVSRTITNSSLLEIDLGGVGDEEGAFITTNPENSSINELNLNSNGLLTYIYQAQENFIGADFVVIRVERGSDGASPNTDITIFELTINIVAE